MTQADVFDGHEFLSREELMKFSEMLKEERAKLVAKSDAIVNSGNIELDRNEMADEVDLASATTKQDLTFKLLDQR